MPRGSRDRPSTLRRSLALGVTLLVVSMVCWAVAIRRGEEFSGGDGESPTSIPRQEPQAGPRGIARQDLEVADRSGVELLLRHPDLSPAAGQAGMMHRERCPGCGASTSG